MNKFKKFIITKILREPLYVQPIKPLFIREERQIDSLGIQSIVHESIPKDICSREIASRLAERLAESEYMKITERPGYIRDTKIIEGRVEVVRRSVND